MSFPTVLNVHGLCFADFYVVKVQMHVEPFRIEVLVDRDGYMFVFIGVVVF